MIWTLHPTVLEHRAPGSIHHSWGLASHFPQGGCAGEAEIAGSRVCVGAQYQRSLCFLLPFSLVGPLSSPRPSTHAYTLLAPPRPSSCCPREQCSLPFSCAGSEVTLTVAYLLSFLSLVCLIHTRKQAPFRGGCTIPFLHEEIETQRGLPMLTRPGSSKTGFKSRFP